MRRHGRVDANQAHVVRTLRAAGVRVFVTSHVGNGFVDVVAYRPATGLLRLIEVKDGNKPPSGRKLTEAEEAFARLFPVSVVNDEYEALAAMGIQTQERDAT
jgi:hypothetical protein